MAMQVEKHMLRRTIQVQHNMAMQVQSLGAHQLGALFEIGQQHKILLGAHQPGALLEIGQQHKILLGAGVVPALTGAHLRPVGIQPIMLQWVYGDFTRD